MRPADERGMTPAVDTDERGAPKRLGDPEGAEQPTAPDRYLPPPDACRKIFRDHVYGLIVLDQDANIRWVNDAVQELTGFAPEETIGHNVTEYLHEDSLALAAKVMTEIEERGDNGSPVVLQLLHADGSPVHFEVGAVDYRDDPEINGLVLRLRPFESQLQLGRLLSLLASGAPLPELLEPLVHSVRNMVRNAEVSLTYGWTGHGFEHAVGTRLPPALTGACGADRGGCGDDAGTLPWVQAFRSAKSILLADLTTLPATLRRAAEAAGFFACWALPVVAPPDQQPVASVVIWRGEPGLPLISDKLVLRQAEQLSTVAFERCHTEELLLRAARYDALTGLANRTFFFAELERSPRPARPQTTAVLYLDLDRFKQVNDTHTHRVGDQVLAEVASMLADNVRPGDLVARLGGDEFAVLCTGVSTTEEVTAIAERLVCAFHQPIQAGGRSLKVGLSIGIALGWDHGLSQDALMDAADHALYQAKRDGRGRWCMAEPT